MRGGINLHNLCLDRTHRVLALSQRSPDNDSTKGECRKLSNGDAQAQAPQ